MSTITKDLGVVTAYGYYKAGGGTMTESEFTQFMVDFGTASKTATEAAQAALESENAAKESEENAAQKSTKASESASTASSKAEEAAASATMATNAKTNAESARDAAAQSASEAAASASQAAESARTLTIDTTPTQGSNNAVSSGGVYEALADVNSDVADLDLRVEELEQGGLSMTAVNLLNTILMEAVYGSDQTANIALLHKELSNIPPVSISAVLDGTALAGQSYSELSFTVTATFDDDSTQIVDNYTIVTTDTVTAGNNTVTIRYRGITTTCTFTAEQVITYSITNNLTNASTSNNTSVIVENDRYAAEIITTSGYDVSVFTVTMGGVDVTSTVRHGNNIVIDTVTGNVVITVTASAPVYLDPLIRRRHGFDNVAYLCPDNHISEATRINNALTPMVSEYPAKYDCTITYRIENNTEESVSVKNLGFALLSGADDVWVTKTEYPYYSALAIPVGGNLAPGEYLEGTYLWKAGYQLVCTTTLDNIGKLDIKLRGNYVPIEYDKDDTYDRYVYNASTPYVIHTYANEITWYADDGTTELTKRKSSKLYTITEQLTAGTYEVVFRLFNDDTANKNMSSTWIAAGTVPVADASVTSVYNSFYTARNNVENTWIYKTVTVRNGNTILVPADIVDLETDNAYVEFYFKEVSA